MSKLEGLDKLIAKIANASRHSTTGDVVLAVGLLAISESIDRIADAVSSSPITEDEIADAARRAHEANRAYCKTLGDDTQIAWADAPEWQRESAIVGVRGVIAGNGPRESHESWLEHKRADGWEYGPVKDSLTKRHPCFVPYDDLPDSQKAKDVIFVSVVRAALGLEID